MAKHRVKLSTKLEAELRDQLEDLLDEHDEVAEKRRQVSKALKGQLDVLGDSIALTRRQLKGVDLEQTRIPGTEMPDPVRDPVVAEILKLAGGLVEKAKKEDDGEDDGEPPALEWHERGENQCAEVDGGAYAIEPEKDGDMNAYWTPTDGRSKRLGTFPSFNAAAAACWEHRQAHVAKGRKP